ncbi:MAG: ROK family protein, partial [Chloroflexota bacterium]
MRIGIDVGGTNTDAVLMENMAILAEVKTATTSDVSTGIISAIEVILEEAKVDPKEITAVMIGTTHFTNAVVERKNLVPVAAIRLGLPATAALPPMIGWPDALSQTIQAQTYLAHGGYEFDGRLISPLKPDEIEDIA